MIWNSWTECWAMGGDGLYVWGRFGVTALCVALEMIWVKNARAQALAQISDELVAKTNSKEWS